MGFYKCKVCGMKYKERSTAGKCSAWCRKHKSCNVEIIKHAVRD